MWYIAEQKLNEDYLEAIDQLLNEYEDGNYEDSWIYDISDKEWSYMISSYDENDWEEFFDEFEWEDWFAWFDCFDDDAWEWFVGEMIDGEWSELFMYFDVEDWENFLEFFDHEDFVDFLNSVNKGVWDDFLWWNWRWIYYQLTYGFKWSTKKNCQTNPKLRSLTMDRWAFTKWSSRRKTSR